MKKFLFFLLTVWATLWLQILHNHFLGGSRFTFDIVLIVVLYSGLRLGPVTGQALGLFWGLLIDASSLGLMGMHMVLYALAGYTSGMLRRQLDENKIVTQSIFTFAVSVCYVACYGVLDHAFASSTRPFGWQIAIQPFMNAMLAPAIFWLMQKWSDLWQLFPVER